VKQCELSERFKYFLIKYDANNSFLAQGNNLSLFEESRNSLMSKHQMTDNAL
jgi:hypothetical protein